MRILKNPNPVEEIVKTCPECECEFAFTDGDVKTYSYSNNILGPGFYGYSKRYVLCPNCGKEIILEENSTDGRNSMYEPDLMTINIKKLMEERIVEPEALGPDIEKLTLFPHLENPEEDGE